MSAVHEAAGLKCWNEHRFSRLQQHHRKRLKKNSLTTVRGRRISTSPSADLAATHDIDLLSFTDDFMAVLLGEHPFFVRYAGCLRSTKRQTPAVLAMLVWVSARIWCTVLWGILGERLRSSESRDILLKPPGRNFRSGIQNGEVLRGKGNDRTGLQIEKQHKAECRYRIEQAARSERCCMISHIKTGLITGEHSVQPVNTASSADDMGFFQEQRKIQDAFSPVEEERSVFPSAGAEDGHQDEPQMSFLPVRPPFHGKNPEERRCQWNIRRSVARVMAVKKLCRLSTFFRLCFIWA